MSMQFNILLTCTGHGNDDSWSATFTEVTQAMFHAVRNVIANNKDKPDLGENSLWRMISDEDCDLHDRYIGACKWEEVHADKLLRIWSLMDGEALQEALDSEEN